MNKKKHHIILKIGLGLLLFILLAVTASGIWFSYHYKKIIKANLPVWVSNATKGLYRVSVKDISINILTRRVTALGVKLWPDTNRVNQLDSERQGAENTFSIEIPQVQVSGILWKNLITNKELTCRKLLLFQPQITVSTRVYRKDSTKNAPGRIQDSTGKSTISHIHIDQIQLIQSNITYHFTNEKNNFHIYAKGCNAWLNDWTYSKGEKKDTGTFLYAKNGTIKIDNFSYEKENRLYNVKSSGINFVTTNNSLTLKDIYISPLMNTDLFYKKVGYQKEIYNIHFPQVELKDFNWRALINDKKFFTSAMVFTDPSINIFFSRIPAPNKKSKLGKYPNQLLQKLALDMAIQNIKINNGLVQYTELNERTLKKGTIRFDNVNGYMHNVSNIDSITAKNKNCEIKLAGHFNGKSTIYAVFNLSLTDTNGYFTVDGNLKDLDEDEINKDARNLALAEIKSFHLNKMDMHIEGSQYFAKGNFTILYDNLKIELQKLDSNSKLTAQPVLSFITNKVFLYPDNPMPAQDVRTATTYLPRNKLKSFFNLIWKSIYEGAQKTALRNEKVLDLVKKKKKK